MGRHDGAVDVSEQTWVLTGAAGQMATSLRPGVAQAVGRLRLLDVQPVAAEREGEESFVVDVRDQDALDAAFAGAQGVLHFAGLADEADFHDLTEINVVGTFHVLEAARRSGVQRVVFASSNRLTGFYPTGVVVDPHMPPRPDGLYGVSKVAGEALCRLYADKFSLDVVSVRIGSFEGKPQDARQMSTWLSPADALRAFLAAMTAPEPGYRVFYAVSRNSRRWWDLSAGDALGYHPQDDAERYADGLTAEHDKRRDAPQGGEYASPSYTLNRQR